MANFNYTTISKVVAELGLQDVQLIPCPTNPRNCTKVIYNGKEYKSSQWTRDEAEAVLSLAQCDMSVPSVARQKVNDAYGDDEIERISHYLDQEATYAKHNAYQYKGASISSIILMGICDFGMTKKEYESMIDIESQARAKASGLLKEVGNYYVPYCTLETMVKHWISENDLRQYGYKEDVIIERFLKIAKQRVNDIVRFQDEYTRA